MKFDKHGVPWGNSNTCPVARERVEGRAAVRVLRSKANTNKTPSTRLFRFAVREAIHAYEKSNRMLDAALAYAANGFPVFPVDVNEKRPIPRRDPDPTGKNERGIPKTGGLYKATCDARQIKAWWSGHEYLIGMPMGKSTRVWALDVDTSEDHADGVSEWNKIMTQRRRTRRVRRQQVLPPFTTREHRSATGGPHLIFNWYAERPIGCSSGKLPKGIEVKGQGSYIVVPPSKRKRRSYTVYSNIDPTDAPKWLIDLILGRKRTAKVTPNKKLLAADPDLLAAAIAVIPNNLPGWERWKNFAMAIWAATGGSDEGFQMLDRFSQRWTMGSYDEGYTQQCWEEITGSPPNRIGAGTLFYMADRARPEWRKLYEVDQWRKFLTSIVGKSEEKTKNQRSAA